MTAAFFLAARVCLLQQCKSNSNATHIHTRQPILLCQWRSRQARGSHAVLGLQWGDGSTQPRRPHVKKMAVQLHPDVNNKDDKNARKISRFTKGLPDYYKLSENIKRLKISTSGDGPFGTRARSIAGSGPMWLVSPGNVQTGS
jgi:hypothetical protein